MNRDDCKQCGESFTPNKSNRKKGYSIFCSTTCYYLSKGGKAHGLRKSPLYVCWNNMKQRCDNPNHPSYKYYGGRGISYDPKWKYFMDFMHDMLVSYSPELTIDRIDNDGDYTKKNCKWATRKQQMNNTRHNHYITFQGVTMSKADWARKININYSTLNNRLVTHKWTVEKALTTKARQRG